jgi:hypothetical protein
LLGVVRKNVERSANPITVTDDVGIERSRISVEGLTDDGEHALVEAMRPRTAS